MINDLMSKEEVFSRIGKKETALWRLRKHHGFPEPVLSHPARFSRAAVEKWIAEGGINRAV
ncbi:DNA-binding protein [Budviciaceae bacterium CWB-B4]|uniref:DNA-binding protein n=1 Tax=Limnobaculum xujianqingii TaxID=2738837 RepID=A0A9D7AGD3_9GAMM|nr:DNA-binding protein [Limnobaculum xujianqingii]MBK5072191.1 DNA-binding protein [Limnobaculum xujianqingii]MBK5175500.1 DNA-binding protein [Limnobaculum xujianqingii]